MSFNRGDARPVHSTAQNPFQDVMAQHEMCGKGRASHAVVGVRAVEGGSAAALHGGGIEGLSIYLYKEPCALQALCLLGCLSQLKEALR
jgi:hypothetical protein